MRGVTNRGEARRGEIKLGKKKCYPGDGKFSTQTLEKFHISERSKVIK